MGDVFDLDALERDATEEPFTFRFGGAEYTLPARLDIRAAAALQGGRIDDALRILLGAEQWQRLQDADAAFDDKHLQALLEAYAAHVGVTLPQ